MTDLVNSPSQVVAQYLVDLGLGSDATIVPVTTPWPVFYSNEPSSPDPVITVFDTVGQINSRSMFDGRYWLYWGIQIRIRSTSFSSGWCKAESIRSTLSQIITELIISGDYLGSNRYCVKPFTGISQALFIGTDTPQTKRTIFTLNLLSLISQIS